MMKLAKIYLAKIKKSKEGRRRRTEVWLEAGLVAQAEYLFLLLLRTE